MTTKYIIQALSQDLYRAAIGFHCGSQKTAQIFTKEAKQKITQLHEMQKDTYLDKLVSRTLPLLSEQKDNIADHLLMYSTLFKNYALYRI